MAEAPPASESERLPGLGVRAVVDGAEVLVGSDALLRSAGIAIPEDSAERAAQARENGAVAMWLARDGEVVALFVLADRLRPEAAASVAALAALGIESAIASGDAAATCEKLAERVGIEMVWAECSPTDKERIARELGTRGAVAVVGDGVNDAAALSIADFAIAVPVVGGSEVAAALADAVLPLSGPPGSPGPLAAIPPLVELGRRTGAIARQNVVWAFGYNLVMVPLAAAGALSPLVAAVCMALSSLAVVANSTRLSVPARRPRSSPVPPIVAPPEPVSSGS
jgi:P-type E1-E2 ATPase